MLKLRSIGIDDYRVLDAGQRIGRIRLVIERMPGVWLWSVTVPLSGDLPTGSSPDFNTAKTDFKAAWEVLKASTPPSLLAAAYKAMILGATTTEGRGEFSSPPRRGKVEHYRLVLVRITDPQAVEALEDLINRLRQEKAGLHAAT
jgi:hypothetical protein